MQVEAKRLPYERASTRSAWPAGTPYNRWTFFSEARRVLEALGPSTVLTILDTHSMLQLLCPDFPLGIVKNAFTPASMLQGASCAPASLRPAEVAMPGESAVVQGRRVSCHEATEPDAPQDVYTRAAL